MHEPDDPDLTPSPDEVVEQPGPRKPADLVRYGRARQKLLALLDDGRLAQALHAAAGYMSRRGFRRLKKIAEGPEGKASRHAQWLLVQLARAAAEVQAHERRATLEIERPEPAIRVRALQPGEKPTPGALVIKTRFAREGEKC